MSRPRPAGLPAATAGRHAASGIHLHLYVLFDVCCELVSAPRPPAPASQAGHGLDSALALVRRVQTGTQIIDRINADFVDFVDLHLAFWRCQHRCKPFYPTFLDSLLGETRCECPGPRQECRISDICRIWFLFLIPDSIHLINDLRLGLIDTRPNL